MFNLRCCTKLKKLDISYKLSLLDLFGLLLLLIPFAFLVALVATIVVTITMLIVESMLENNQYLILIESIIFAGIALLIFLKCVFKFLHACSFLVNYKFKLITNCKTCGHSQVVVNLPDNSEPI